MFLGVDMPSSRQGREDGKETGQVANTLAFEGDQAERGEFEVHRISPGLVGWTDLPEWKPPVDQCPTPGSRE